MILQRARPVVKPSTRPTPSLTHRSSVSSGSQWTGLEPIEGFISVKYVKQYTLQARKGIVVVDPGVGACIKSSHHRSRPNHNVSVPLIGDSAESIYKEADSRLAKLSEKDRKHYVGRRKYPCTLELVQLEDCQAFKAMNIKWDAKTGFFRRSSAGPIDARRVSLLWVVVV